MEGEIWNCEKTYHINTSTQQIPNDYNYLSLYTQYINGNPTFIFRYTCTNKYKVCLHVLRG